MPSPGMHILLPLKQQIRLSPKVQINGLVFLNLRTTHNLLTHNVF
jgi:hypothetical protein